MRSYRRILIGNGLANIPAKICSIGSSALKSQIGNGCPACQGDVGKKNYCKGCGQEPTNDEIIKLLKISKTERIPIKQEHLDQLKEKELKIEILGTLAEKDIDGIVLGMTDNVYYIFEDEKSRVTKPLGILKSGIEQSKNVLVVNSTISGSSKVGLVRSVEIQGKTVLILQLVKYMEYANKIDEDYTAVLTPDEEKLGLEYVANQIKPIDLKTIEDPSAKVIQDILDGTPITVTTPSKATNELAFFGAVEA